MRRDLLIAAGPGEWRAALVEDDAAVELFVIRDERHELNSLHLGRVRQLVPGLAAALVDIGDERPAFLPVAEAAGMALHEGARILVQVRREAQSGKAARLTARPVVPGRHVELRIGRPGLLGADELAPEDRARLREISSAAGAEGLAWGLRVLAAAPAADLVAETAALLRRWQVIANRAAASDPPARIGPSPGHSAALAAATSAAPPERVVTDERATVPELRAAFPDAAVEYGAQEEWPIDLDAAFDLALAPEVALAGGGTLHFEPTRAGVLIDVDSGQAAAASPERGALAVNFAAAAAIARHIRMRRLGGGIVIDFVGLDRRDLRERVRLALAAALAADPAAPEILGWTRLGHLELVRPRRARPLAEIMLAPVEGLVKTPVTIAFEALRALARAARAEPGRRWRLTAAPEVAAALAGAAAQGVAELETRFGRPLSITADPDVRRFQIAAA